MHVPVPISLIFPLIFIFCILSYSSSVVARPPKLNSKAPSEFTALLRSNTKLLGHSKVILEQGASQLRHPWALLTQGGMMLSAFVPQVDRDSPGRQQQRGRRNRGGASPATSWGRGKAPGVKGGLGNSCECLAALPPPALLGDSSQALDYLLK